MKKLRHACPDHHTAMSKKKQTKKKSELVFRKMAPKYYCLWLCFFFKWGNIWAAHTILGFQRCYCLLMWARILLSMSISCCWFLMTSPSFFIMLFCQPSTGCYWGGKKLIKFTRHQKKRQTRFQQNIFLNYEHSG